MVSHTDPIYDCNSACLWTQVFHESYKSTEKLNNLCSTFCLDMIHILFPWHDTLRLLLLDKETSDWHCRFHSLSQKSLQTEIISCNAFLNSAHSWATQCPFNFASWFSTFCMVCLGSEWNLTYTWVWENGLFWKHCASADNSEAALLCKDFFNIVTFHSSHTLY